MIKKTIVVAIISLLIVSCACNNKSDKQIVGNDRDKNNCIGSAGYQWSELEKRCVRPFEEGVKLTSVNNSTYAAYIMKKQNKLELFSVETSPTLILEKQTETIWQNGDWKVEFLNNKYTVKNKNLILYQN